MPELPEVEASRRLAHSAALDRKIARVISKDTFFMKGATTERLLRAALVGAHFTEARRIGKLLMLDTSEGDILGLRFGMTGTLIVDTAKGVEELMYSSHRALPEWDRFTVIFEDGGNFRINDPRRLGAVELDPDIERLGPDALGLSLSDLRAQIADSRAPLKARLMDQSRIAGVGNLIADEALWRAGLDPARPANSLTDAELRKLQRHLVKTVDDLIERGGSHTGDMLPHRVVGGVCPEDGTPWLRRQVGGRTTFSCPKHQV